MTRHRVMDATYALLLEAGYAGTTMTAVAERAGVAVPTVYKAFGTKVELVKRLYDRVLAGDGLDIPLAARVEAQDLLSEPDPRRAIELYAALASTISARLAALLAVLLGAASTNPELQDFVTAVEAERRSGNERFAQHLYDRGALRIDPGRATDLLWLFTAPDTYHRLVTQRGWTDETFRDWLTEILSAQLLP
ncbi:TetR/AcrR family transcriptional regulator [Micromonospora sp. NPDC000089]|uniref:TetR/AcrR family transcriptional regulator n=1 Tax=unclassified Micromonospora TaxID=2617518 RepID=UPI0036D10931